MAKTYDLLVGNKNNLDCYQFYQCIKCLMFIFLSMVKMSLRYSGEYVYIILSVITLSKIISYEICWKWVGYTNSKCNKKSVQ